MRGFSCLVVLPAFIDPCDPAALADAVRALLAPYSRSRQVDPYVALCGCRVRGAWNRLADGVAREHGYPSFAAFSQLFGHLYPGVPLDQADAARPVLATLDARAQAAAPAEPPSPDCLRCGGRGAYATTENPDARYGTWAVDPDEAPFPLRAYPASAPPPPAVVTPDGAWHAGMRLDDWGLTVFTQPPAAWAAAWRALRAQHLDAPAVWVRCGI